MWLSGVGVNLGVIITRETAGVTRWTKRSFLHSNKRQACWQEEKTRAKNDHLKKMLLLLMGTKVFEQKGRSFIQSWNVNHRTLLQRGSNIPKSAGLTASILVERPWSKLWLPKCKSGGECTFWHSFPIFPAIYRSFPTRLKNLFSNLLQLLRTLIYANTCLLNIVLRTNLDDFFHQLIKANIVTWIQGR